MARLGRVLALACCPDAKLVSPHISRDKLIRNPGCKGFTGVKRYIGYLIPLLTRVRPVGKEFALEKSDV